MAVWKRLRDSVRGAADKVVPRPGGEIGGESSRGVVIEVINAPWGDQQDSYAMWSRVTVSLRRAGDDAGAPTTVDVYLKPRGWRAIQAGQDVPIRFDGQTGALLGLDADAYEAEVDEGRHAAPDHVPDMEPDAAAVAPIEGVSLDLWATTLAGIARDMIAPDAQDAFAAARGVPAGRWVAINAEWQQRSHSDWKVGAQFGATFQAEMQRRS